ncbi:uncharacterized protein E5676_scaffold349G00450 [Cucumis melo var. makuwa]|uniref:Uncharacterized protein n=1 Tax=Cucumis melo var. makuwa TaxID=1194695 RepID=A0A5D3E3H3_CUCMM|nr:uncharacterized protein E6C27_scaffold56G001740 [Cucumis melo var. makuwa]TYK30436.1 uncharacterized protein E5676_scaffold349G00450 [Cucumis melo var. makuwa]
MDEQTNDQIQVVCQDFEGLKDQLTKVLELLTARTGKSVIGTSSQVQAIHVSDLISTPITESGKKVSEEQDSRRRLKFLEERLRVIEGRNNYESIDVAQLCLISDVYNIDMPPNRLDLQRMEKKNVELLRSMYNDEDVEHSMEDCFPLKAKVQSLVQVGWLKFKKIEKSLMLTRTLYQIMKVFEILHGAGYLSPRFNNDDGEKIGCANGKQSLFHPEINDNSIENCCEFKTEVQKLMDAKILLVGQMSMQEIEGDMITNASSNKETSNGTSIAVISENTIPPHPLVYQCSP